MPIRTASAKWEGNLRDGEGKMAFPGGGFQGNYSFGSRFEEGTGTNPEELIAAAHAGCFSMSLSGELTKAGFRPTKVDTTAKAHLDKANGGYRISSIELDTQVEVDGIEDQRFQQIARSAKENCPVSQALKGVEVRLNARVVS